MLTFSFLRSPFETFSTHLASSWSLWWLWLTLAQEEKTHLAGWKQNPTETGETDQITSEGPSNDKFCRFPSNNMCQVWIKQNIIQTFSIASELSKESHTDNDELSLPYFYVANRGHRAPGALRLRVHTSTTRWFPEMNLPKRPRLFWTSQRKYSCMLSCRIRDKSAGTSTCQRGYLSKGTNKVCFSWTHGRFKTLEFTAWLGLLWSPHGENAKHNCALFLQQ